MTKTIDMNHAISISELVSLALSGMDIILAEGEKPLVRITSIAPKRTKRIANLNAGAVVMSDDFNDPLPDSFWEGKE